MRKMIITLICSFCFRECILANASLVEGVSSSPLVYELPAAHTDPPGPPGRTQARVQHHGSLRTAPSRAVARSPRVAGLALCRRQPGAVPWLPWRHPHSGGMILLRAGLVRCPDRKAALASSLAWFSVSGDGRSPELWPGRRRRASASAGASWDSGRPCWEESTRAVGAQGFSPLVGW